MNKNMQNFKKDLGIKGLTPKCPMEGREEVFKMGQNCLDV